MATFRELTTEKGERRWQAVVRRKGVPARHATFTTKRDAVRWAQATEGQLAQQRHLPMLEAERHTLSDLLTRFEDDLPAQRKKAVAAHLAWWKAALGSTRLSELTAAAIRQQRDRLRAEPYTRSKQRKEVTLTPRRKPKAVRLRNRSPSSVNRYTETLSKALSVAVREYEWTNANPCSQIADLKEPQGRVRILTADERKALLEACAARSPDLHALVTVALCTGARAGELLGLRWGDVDLARHRAILNRTKNEDRRALTISGPALEVLQARSKVRRIDTDLVFADSAKTKDGKPRPYDYAKDFRAAVSNAGIEDLRFHDARHTMASYLAMSGATTAEIAATLGHRTLAMVKRYSHLTDSHVSSVVERMVAATFGTAEKAS